MNVIGILEAESLKPSLPRFKAGDRVRVHVKVVSRIS